MSANFSIIMTEIEKFFDSFNILDYGLVIIWIVGGFFMSTILSERRDEKALATLSIIMFGGLFFFAEDPKRYVLLIVSVLIALYGFFRMLWVKRQQY